VQKCFKAFDEEKRHLGATQIKDASRFKRPIFVPWEKAKQRPNLQKFAKILCKFK